MPNINITVAKKIATNMTPNEAIVCGNNDYTVTFNLDQEWTGEQSCIARFVWVRDGEIFHTDAEIVNNVAAVPVLHDVREVCVGVLIIGAKASTPARIPCKPAICCDSGTEVEAEA